MGVLKVGSMFAGIGGICLGFQQAGYKVEWAIEMDQKACITYERNMPETKLYQTDVKELDPKTLEKVDVLTSGFPCQAFSLAGLRRGFKDPRGNLFFETARYIKVLKPKAVLFENVKNLVTHNKGATFETIRKTMLDLGYSFDYKVLNSCTHINIPQNRARVFIVCFRKGTLGYKAYKKLFNSTTVFSFPQPIPLKVAVQDLLEPSVGEEYYFSSNHKYMPLLKKAMRDPTKVYQWRRVYIRENKAGVCPTLTANMGTGGHNVPLVIDNGFRKLTPRECARLQGFPDSFILPDIAKSNLYKQLGNSVTVPLIKKLAEQIKDFI